MKISAVCTYIYASALYAPSFVQALAVPPPVDINAIQVVPGPGLPSLESLNLTVADLIRTADEHAAARSRAAKRQVVTPVDCLGAPWAAVGMSNTCVGYLLNLGNTNCVAAGTAGGTKMCITQAGNQYAEIVGSGGGSQTVTVPCWEVALAAQDVQNRCQFLTSSSKQLVSAGNSLIQTNPGTTPMWVAIDGSYYS